MNKKGFTLVELIAVVALVALIALIALPNVLNLQKKNKDKEYEVYEDMMVEHAKASSLYKRGASTICLSDLEMPNLNNTTCNGYVKVFENTLTPYLSCSQDNELLYETDNYNLPTECDPSIEANV